MRCSGEHTIASKNRRRGNYRREARNTRREELEGGGINVCRIKLSITSHAKLVERYFSIITLVIRKMI